MAIDSPPPPSAKAAEPETLLVHEWLEPRGGSENVFEDISAVFPDARRACLWNNAPERFNGVQETWLARTPLRRSKAASLPLMPWAWRSVDLGRAERVVVSSHAFAHQVATRAAGEGRDAFAYVHTPARYLWAPELDPRGESLPVRTVARLLKPIDRRLTSSAVSYAANSEFIRKRIQRAWGRDAQVIYPPVDTERIASVADWASELAGEEADRLAALPPEYVLGASRLVEYKRLDLVIHAAARLGLPTVIAGSGPDEARLRGLATDVKAEVHFVGHVSDAGLYTLYQRARLFAFLPVEDFGIMPVEAMAAGTPVLVNLIGGARESVMSVSGGAEVDPTLGIDAVVSAAREAMSVDMSLVRARVGKYFSCARFADEVSRWVGVGTNEAATGPQVTR